MPAPVRWTLPDHPDLHQLRTQAKEIRRHAAEGDSATVELCSTYDPGDGPVTLARAQRVLARACGFAGWSTLIEHVRARAELSRPMEPGDDADDADDRFLRLACLNYTEPYRADRAVALLAVDPSLATRSAATLAACGRADDLVVLLAADPSAATREVGPHRWPPLLYVCYSRLDLGDPVRTARMLLDAGADPDSGFLWKGLPSPFTALTGVLGGGERYEPPHPQALELAEMLLDAGADPNDNQAFYNRQFRSDDRHLGPLLRHGAGHDHPSPWRDRLGAAYPSPEQMVGEHLRSAAEHGFDNRVRILLAHGVDPNTRGYHPILGDQTAYEIAVRFGQAGAARLLAEAGGRSDRIDDADRLLMAAVTGDGPTMAQLRERVPDLTARRPRAVGVAAAHHDIGALARLLALGYSVNAAGRDGVTALHEAALRGNRAMCEWLVDNGADRTVLDRRFTSNPAGWAAHAGHEDLAGWLAPAE